MKVLDELASELRTLADTRWTGEVVGALGATIEVAGLERRLAIGETCSIQTRSGSPLMCEAVGFRDGHSLVMPLGDLDGVALGTRAVHDGRQVTLRPTQAWLGRVIDAMGRPIDGKGRLEQGPFVVPLRNTPPNAYARKPIGEKLATGVRALDVMAPISRGQRMGIFAGSGVGKSTLLSMLARNSDTDVNVVGLIGERGREVREFIDNYLGPEGLARSIIIVSTSDDPPLLRRQAAYATLAIAEDQRKQGKQVLCVIDSITRFAMAQREIGLAAGEPPTAKGYPPTVFSELPKLLERAGSGIDGQGDITGVFTVLVDGDDHNEPIADAVRGILDGHIVLSRRIAERGRYPAIDLLKSISRTMPECHSAEQNAICERVRGLLSTYEDKEDIIRIGAYKAGSDPAIDAAIARYSELETFFNQLKEANTPPEESFATLAKIVGMEMTSAAGNAPSPENDPDGAAPQGEVHLPAVHLAEPQSGDILPPEA